MRFFCPTSRLVNGRTVFCISIDCVFTLIVLILFHFFRRFFIFAEDFTLLDSFYDAPDLSVALVLHFAGNALIVCNIFALLHFLAVIIYYVNSTEFAEQKFSGRKTQNIWKTRALIIGRRLRNEDCRRTQNCSDLYSFGSKSYRALTFCHLHKTKTSLDRLIVLLTNVINLSKIYCVWQWPPRELQSDVWDSSTLTSRFVGSCSCSLVYSFDL